MPKMSDRAKKNKAAYDTKYILSHVRQKRINFNDQNEEDMRLLEWLESQDNQNQYMKDLIRDDMGRAGK